MGSTMDKPVGVLVVAVIVALSACRGCERQETSHPNLAAANSSSAGRGQWIPTWLSGSSHDIREVHDLDTNAQVIALRYDSSDQAALMGSLSRIGEAQVDQAVAACSLEPEWWPSQLRCKQLASTLRSGAFDVFKWEESLRYADGREERSVAFVALSKDGRLFLWR
jgi:hypothetical protein